MARSSNPAAANNNRHHMGGYHSEQEFLDETLGRGAGDPDMYGYPEQDPKVLSQNIQPTSDILSSPTSTGPKV